MTTTQPGTRDLRGHRAEIRRIADALSAAGTPITAVIVGQNPGQIVTTRTADAVLEALGRVGDGVAIVDGNPDKWIWFSLFCTAPDDVVSDHDESLAHIMYPDDVPLADLAGAPAGDR